MNAEHFDLYTDYLISSFGPVTATGLSRMLDGQLSHDQVTRLLSCEPKNSADLWKVVKPLVRAIESTEGTISIDDSISKKPYNDDNDLIAWHWSYTFERHVKGLEFLTAYYNVGDVSLPIAFDLADCNPLETAEAFTPGAALCLASRGANSGRRTCRTRHTSA